jgi:hypothetical protein
MAGRELCAQPRNPITVVARVSDAKAGVALPNVLVRLTELGVGALTDSVGRARFGDVPAGRYTIEARRVGYALVTQPLRVGGSDSVVVELNMQVTTRRLAPVTVTDTAVPAVLREFEERRRRGTGRYITQAQIQQAFGSTLPDLLSAHFPGVRVNGTASNSRDGKRCTLVAYLDGVHLIDGNLGVVDPALLGGVEYYTMTSIPVQYRLSSSTSGRIGGTGALHCGVLLFWSRG